MSAFRYLNVQKQKHPTPPLSLSHFTSFRSLLQFNSSNGPPLMLSPLSFSLYLLFFFFFFIYSSPILSLSIPSIISFTPGICIPFFFYFFPTILGFCFVASSIRIPSSLFMIPDGQIAPQQVQGSTLLHPPTPTTSSSRSRSLSLSFFCFFFKLPGEFPILVLFFIHKY